MYTLFITFFLTFNNPTINVALLNNLFIYDNLFITTKYILLFTFFIWAYLSFNYLEKEVINIFEYWILALFSLFAMLCLVSSFDILTIYLAIELQSLIFYIIASLNRTSEFSTEAGLKYFILGAFSSALLLLGFSLLYSITGLTHLEDLNKLFLKEFLLGDLYILQIFFLSALLILTSLMFKISAAPFHMWSPDIYEGAPTSVTAFFALMPKIAVVTLLIRIFHYNLQDVFYFWQKILLFCALLSLIIGTFSAFVQTKWKRFLAFSSISHVGFMLLSLSTGTLAGNEVTMYYIIIYVFMTVTLFTAFLSLRYKIYNNDYQIRYMKDINMLGKINPALSFCIVLTLFSMGGIPPLAGFLAKVLVILESVKTNLIIFAIFSVVMSSVACFYYLRLIKNLYFTDLGKWPIFIPINKELALLFSLSSMLLLYFCLDPSIVQLPLKLCFSKLQI